MGCGASTQQDAAFNSADATPLRDSKYKSGESVELLKPGDVAARPTSDPLENSHDALSAAMSADAAAASNSTSDPASLGAPAREPAPDYDAPTHEKAAELFGAISEGDAELLTALLAEGVPAGVVDGDGCTPLHKAAEGEGECAQLLVDRLDASSGVFEVRNREDETALLVAIRYEDAEIAKILLDGGAKATAEAIDKARASSEPDVIAAVTGEEVADRPSPAGARKGDERRVSVSAQGDINSFTRTFSGETGEYRSKRASFKEQGGAQEAAARAAIEAVGPVGLFGGA